MALKGWIHQRNTFLLRAVLLSCLAVIIIPTASFAQSSGIGGKPANPDSSNPRTKTIFVKTIEPGMSTSDAVAVTNNSDTAKTILIYGTDSVASSGGAFACAQAVEPTNSVGRWISLGQSSVEVPANSTVNVPFTLHVPDSAEPGEQNGCIVLQEKKDATLEGGIALSFRTAIRVAILVPGEVHKDVIAKSLMVNSKGSSIIVSPTVQNTGNVSVDVGVTSQIKTIFNTVVTQHKDTFPVLRDQLTTWNFDLQKPYWGGLYLATYTLSYDESSNYIGTTNNESKTKTITGQTKLFFALPNLSALCIELFVIILIAGTVLRFYLTKARRRAVAEHWVEYKVRKDDQLQAIATKRSVSWRTLAKTNGIKAPYSLSVGQVLKVPAIQKVKKQPKQSGTQEK